MADIEIIWKIPKAQVGAIALDATVSEEHSADADITSHPVEDGAPVSDHIRAQPDTITLQGIISDTPISEADRRATDDTESAGRAEKAFHALRQLRDTGQVVDVITGLHVYRSMAVKSLRAPRDARTGDALRFTITLAQVRKVQTQTVAIQARTFTSRGFVGPPNLGTQVKKPAAQAQKDRSVLRNMLGGVLGLDKRPPASPLRGS